MDLYKLRMEIDRVDAELLPLLLRRMDLVKEVGIYKKTNNLPILDTSREAEVLEKVCDPAPPEYKKYVKETYKKIMEVSKNFQADSMGEE